MTRRDFQGITGAIRELSISTHSYTTILNFFHATSWKIEDIEGKWIEIIKESGCMLKKDGYCVLLGDGIKKGKEARKMPAVKKHHQESENTSKPTYIFGHLFGVHGLLIGREEHKFCVPVSARIQNGAEVIRSFSEKEKIGGSHVVQMMEQCCQTAKILQEPTMIVLDRYFLTKNALESLSNFQKEHKTAQIAIVTRAKINATANEKPIPKEKKGRARPAKLGKELKLKDLFITQSERFVKAKVTLYGQSVEISYLCLNLLWDKDTQLRYVLVHYENKQCILVCSDLLLDPLTIIELYGMRQKIEATFKSLSQTIGGFDYHFWNKQMPKLDRYRKKDEKDPLEAIADDKVHKSIQNTLKAIEGYVTIACIANGLLSMISILFRQELIDSPLRWLRTPNFKAPSEATVSDVLRCKTFMGFFAISKKISSLPIIRIIRAKQLRNPFRLAS